MIASTVDYRIHMINNNNNHHYYHHHLRYFSSFHVSQRKISLTICRLFISFCLVNMQFFIFFTWGCHDGLMKSIRNKLQTKKKKSIPRSRCNKMNVFKSTQANRMKREPTETTTKKYSVHFGCHSLHTPHAVTSRCVHIIRKVMLNNREKRKKTNRST